MDKSCGAGFGQWIDADNLTTSPCSFLQRSQHARVIGPGILTQDKDGIGMLEIVECDRGLANPNDFLHGHAAGLVAHVGGIG